MVYEEIGPGGSRTVLVVMTAAGVVSPEALMTLTLTLGSMKPPSSHWPVTVPPLCLGQAVVVVPSYGMRGSDAAVVSAIDEYFSSSSSYSSSSSLRWRG